MFCCGREWSSKDWACLRSQLVESGRATNRLARKCFRFPETQLLRGPSFFGNNIGHQPWQAPNAAPQSWSLRRRRYITAVVCIQSFSISLAASASSIGSASSQVEFRTSPEVIKLGITCFTLLVAIAPLFFAPLSEQYGRRNVYIFSWFLYWASFSMTGFAPSVTVYLLGRAIMGTFGSVSSTVVGGSLSDIWPHSSRNQSMALLAFSALFGTSSGPLSMGYVVQRLGWRWIEYIQFIFNGLVMIIILTTMPETRHATPNGPVISVLNGPISFWHSLSRSSKVLAKSPKTPLFFLFTEPIVAVLSLWISFAWGVLYLFLEAIPYVMQAEYAFDTASSGLAFGGLAAGFTIGLGIFLGHEHIRTIRGADPSPENTFMYASLGGWFFPAGLLWFGLGTLSSHYTVSILGTLCAASGIFNFYLAIFCYLSAIYDRHTSSAFAAQSFLRNIFASGFPLFAQPFYEKLGAPKASAILAGVAAVLSMVPIFLKQVGPTLRKRSIYLQMDQNNQQEVVDVIQEDIASLAHELESREARANQPQLL